MVRPRNILHVGIGIQGRKAENLEERGCGRKREEKPKRGH